MTQLCLGKVACQCIRVTLEWNIADNLNHPAAEASVETYSNYVSFLGHIHGQPKPTLMLQLIRYLFPGSTSPRYGLLSNELTPSDFRSSGRHGMPQDAQEMFAVRANAPDQPFKLRGQERLIGEQTKRILFLLVQRDDLRCDSVDAGTLGHTSEYVGGRNC